MAWYTYQIFADFLNRTENHDLVTQAFSGILADDVVLHYGASEFVGKKAVIDFFENISNAIVSEYGFDAVPVIISDTEDTEFNFTKDGKYTALALLSKLEAYISWFFILRCNQQFLVNRINSSRGQGYSVSYDYYVRGNYDYSTHEY